MRIQSNRGQSLIEFTLVLPLLLLTALGVVEVSYALLDQHVVTKLTREGSNLISRNTALGDAAAAIRTMSTRPVNLENGSKLIFSVIRNIPTTGAANYNKAVLAQRYQYGNLAKPSTLKTSGSASFGPGPEYQAANQDGNTGLQVTNMPITLSLGGTLYVTELYTTHPRITPLAGFGIQVPQTLYSIAYF
ncbi:MAG TPA: TadE/TadG family type IV pilus assembly protein [Vicinamibacterales bacterium]